APLLAYRRRHSAHYAAREASRMPLLQRDGAEIHYDVYGEGYPLILFAPGGMHSVAEMWRQRPGAPGQRMPWIDPTAELSDRFQVVAMDQRNAGRSSAPISATDGWATFTADHLALIDHLGFPQVHVMGGCIGSSYCLGLCQAAPDRVTAAVLQNPIGLSADNRDTFFEMFDSWSTEMQARRHDIDEDALQAFRQSMFGGDFVFSATRDFVGTCPVPLLVLAGNDEFHPTAVAQEIAELAPDAELVLEWTSPTHHEATLARVRLFLGAHTPAPT
ncbi:MAG TPA: alpha/beta fold hydrolase, partial [Acidimicrobiales bacterium]